MSANTDVAMRFVEAVNGRSTGALTSLLAEDHVFVDSTDGRVTGREANRNAWIGYFVMIPDYRIAVEKVLEEGDTVVLLGTAEGTFAPDGVLSDSNRWRLPAAWRLRIVNGLVAELQMYADNEPVRAIMARSA
jgi:ketosteroid isomerase-like protein